jgi:hypothetical protein
MILYQDNQTQDNAGNNDQNNEKNGHVKTALDFQFWQQNKPF